ncbi:ATP-binding protein, partial [Faecalibacterium prausnitzii]
LDYFITEVIFCQALFSKFFVSYRTWSVLGFSALAGTFGRLLVLFALLPAGTQKSFFCLSAWRSSIIPYAGPLCKPFLHFFRLFLHFVYISQFFAQFQGMF